MCRSGSPDWQRYLLSCHSGSQQETVGMKSGSVAVMGSCHWLILVFEKYLFPLSRVHSCPGRLPSHRGTFFIPDGPRRSSCLKSTLLCAPALAQASQPGSLRIALLWSVWSLTRLYSRSDSWSLQFVCKGGADNRGHGILLWRGGHKAEHAGGHISLEYRKTSGSGLILS